MRLRDKVIIVTGSTSGIGRAIAERAVVEGARVLIHGIDRAAGEKVVAGLGTSAALHLDDVSDPAAAARIVAAAVAAFGRVDAVVNNAALVARSTLATTSAENFDRMMAINVRAPLLLIQAALAQLQQHRGCVLNIGSINALSGEATLLDYSISKGALQTLTAYRSLLEGTTSEDLRRGTSEMLQAIASHRVGDRPNRYEPRAIKRRPKPHDLLTVPRDEAKRRLAA